MANNEKVLFMIRPEDPLFADLCELFGLKISACPTHDEEAMVVAGLFRNMHQFVKLALDAKAFCEALNMPFLSREELNNGSV